VEKGLLPINETLKKRSDQLRTARDGLLAEVARARQEMLLPVAQVLPGMVDAFSRGVRRKLQDREFAKRYLQLLVDKIVVSEDSVRISGSKAKLATAIHSYKKRALPEKCPVLCVHGAPDTIRTCDPCLRRAKRRSNIPL